MRYPDEPEDRVFGADSAAAAVDEVLVRVSRYMAQNPGERRRS
ncbi:MAG: hypothetical protein ABL997_08760 [Planctomycetota bacterium]